MTGFVADRARGDAGAGTHPGRAADAHASGPARLVLGVGMSSKATVEEVRELARRVVDQAGFRLDAVALVATRERFAADERVRLGPPVVAVDDAVLLDRFPAPQRSDGGGFAARVAEGCAMTAAGESAELLVGTTRSPHATAAIASPGEPR
jgi:hypothetical protein